MESSTSEDEAFRSAKLHIEEIRTQKFSIGKKESNSLTVDLHQAVTSLSADLYQKDIHFLMELIQNAEDNEYTEGVEPTLEFVLTKKDITGTGAPATLLVFNNEVGFTRKNMDSICSIGRSTRKGKRQHGYIGEKRIGFKSVFLVSSQPHIFSNGYRVRFKEEPDQDCGVGYVVPQWVSGEPYLSSIQDLYGCMKILPMTTLILPLKPDKVEAVRTQLLGIHPEILLFLTKLKGLYVRGCDAEETDDVSMISMFSETEHVEFGYDQDIPCFVAHGSSDIFLPAGMKGHENVSLYIPSRLAEEDVSTRYLKWRKESVADFKHKIMPLKIGARRSSIEEETNEINDTTIPCTSEYLVEPFTGRNQGNDSLVPPGFAPKRLRVEPEDPVDEDHLTLLEAIKKRKKVNVDKGSNGENLSAPDQYVATSVADESSVTTMMLESTRKDIVLSKPLFWVGNGKRKPRKQRNVMRLVARSRNQDLLSFKDKERASSSRLFENRDFVSSTFAFEWVAELKSRVSILEKMVEVLKASTFGNNITDLSELVI